MPRQKISCRIPILVLAMGTVTLSCSTTYNTSVTTTTEIATTTTVPTGTTAELLQKILVASQGLSDSITTDTADARERIAYINANWDVAKDDLDVLSRDEFEGIERLINLANTAVTRKRPADADKVAKFLPAVIDSIVSKL